MKWYIDLQLFADEEKTEQPTPKRRREAREKGQVFKSIEVNTVIILLVSFISLKAIFPNVASIFMDYQRGIYNSIGPAMDEVFTSKGLSNLLLGTVFQIGRMLWPLILVLIVVGVAVNVAQVGFVFSTKPLAANLSRLDPIAGFKRIFSKRALNELVKSVLKIVLVGYIAYTELSGDVDRFLIMSRESVSTMASDLVDVVYRGAIKLVAVMAIIAVVDYIFQRREYEQSLKMTKQEIKQELKETEGDPQIKSRIRQIQRQLAVMRMMQQVPKADVVITNPTHFAVALRYKADVDDAPLVLAKGADYLAQRIKELAKQSHVPIVENRELARALYYGVDIGQIIPPEFYEMVAEVLAYVYNLGRR